jgi:hypothetical protein
MGFKAFRSEKGSDHTSENEAFDDLYDLLKGIWDDRDEEIMLFGNILANGSDIDALAVTEGAVIIIELKNYEGDLKVSENNDWVIKRGNSKTVVNKGRKNPYQQIKKQRDSLKSYLLQSGIEKFNKSALNRISGIVMFQKNVEIVDIPGTLKYETPWFHIFNMTDKVHRRVNQIRSNAIKLNSVDLKKLISYFSLPEYFPDGKPKAVKKLVKLQPLDNERYTVKTFSKLIKKDPDDILEILHEINIDKGGVNSEITEKERQAYTSYINGKKPVIQNNKEAVHVMEVVNEDSNSFKNTNFEEAKQNPKTEKDRMIEYARATVKKQWSEIKEFEDYNDNDPTYLKIKLKGMSDSLLMHKSKFYREYPGVVSKLKFISLGQQIRYKTTLNTVKGEWEADKWFSDIEIIAKETKGVLSSSNDRYRILSVDIVPGISLNPSKVWRGEMQLVTTDYGIGIDNMPGISYGKEVPGYNWLHHIGGEPMYGIQISASIADYPWIKKG